MRRRSGRGRGWGRACRPPCPSDAAGGASGPGVNPRMAPADGAYSAADMASACPPAKLGGMQIYRSSLLRFADDGQALYDEDGLLAVAPDDRGQQRVVAAGSWQALQAQLDRKSTRL